MRMSGATFIDGISPPLEQIQEDHTPPGTQNDKDILALISEIARLTAALEAAGQEINRLTDGIAKDMQRVKDAEARHRSLVESDTWYAGLDSGIRFPVRVLHAKGIHTGQSCEGGEGHSYDRPTIDLAGNGDGAGFAACAALEEYGLRVRDVGLLWTVDRGLISDTFWRITLWQQWPARANEIPIFEWRYRARP